MNPEETCDECAYFEDVPGMPTAGACHCHPPVIAFGITPQGPQPVPVSTAFPPTPYKSWCGEWKKGNLVKLTNKIPLEPGRN